MGFVLFLPAMRELMTSQIVPDDRPQLLQQAMSALQRHELGTGQVRGRSKDNGETVGRLARECSVSDRVCMSGMFSQENPAPGDGPIKYKVGGSGMFEALMWR
jgi:hypothetical protein